MLDITLLPSAKVPLIYPDTSGMTTEWYRFFWNVYGFTGDATGAVPVSKGGTGLTSIGEHQLIIGNAAGVFEKTELIGSGITITYAPGTTTLAIGNSGVTPGTYGSASAVGQFTVDAKGTLVFAQNVTIAIDASQIISGTIASARISGSYTGITGVGTLTAGTWNATTIATSYGGTGLTSFTSGGALYATSTSILTSGTLPVTAGGTGQTSFINGQLLIGNTTGNTLTKATLTAGTGVSISNGAGSITISATGSGGTVTSVAALTLGTTGTDLSSTVVNDTTTPVITLNVPTASATNRGVLSSTDWTIFNNKAPAFTYTSNYIPYGQGTTTPTQSTGLQYNGATFITTGISTTNNLTFTGTTNRITGDFSNATPASRVAFQSSTTNGNSIVSIIPNGTATISSIQTFNTSDPSNSAGLGFVTTSAEARISSFINGTGTYLPITILTGGSEKARIFTSGGVSIGNTTDPGAGGLRISGLMYPQQATTAGAPAYVKGSIYFDTTLNKLRVGGATAWETITSV